MTAAPFPSREALLALVEKWQQNAEVLARASGNPRNGEIENAKMLEGSQTLDLCADDLEALLRLQDQGRPEESKTSSARKFPYGMNAEDHAATCDIRTSRDGWDADCTCGTLLR